MLHAEPFETHLLSAELCVLFIYFLKGNCIGLEYHIILSKIHIIVIIKTKIIDQNKSCSNSIHILPKTFVIMEIPDFEDRFRNGHFEYGSSGTLPFHMLYQPFYLMIPSFWTMLYLDPIQ